MKAWLLFVAFVVLAAAGCTTKSKARANAEAAFRAGQQQTFSTLADARRVNIRFIGPVRNPEIAWVDGLTLAQAIAAAGYFDARDPNVILIVRQRERINVSAHELLNGKDWPLEPGDMIEMQP